MEEIKKVKSISIGYVFQSLFSEGQNIITVESSVLAILLRFTIIMEDTDVFVDQLNVYIHVWCYFFLILRIIPFNYCCVLLYYTFSPASLVLGFFFFLFLSFFLFPLFTSSLPGLIAIDWLLILLCCDFTRFTISVDSYAECIDCADCINPYGADVTVLCPLSFPRMSQLCAQIEGLFCKNW